MATNTVLSTTSETPPYTHVEMVVWSGTGNSRYVAEQVAAAAQLRGLTAHIATPSNLCEAPTGPNQLLGLLGPTHGFTAPWPVLKAALTLPHVRGRDVFVLVTRGAAQIQGKIVPGFEGTAAYLPAALLALRGARVRGAGGIDMPLNWTVVVSALDVQTTATIVERGEAQTAAFAERLLDGQPVFWGYVQLLIGLLILPLSLGYMLLGRLMLAKAFYADERCTACGICVANCPQHAIRLKRRFKRPYWTYQCHNCMRCMSACPTEAIQGGQAWLLFYTWLLTVPVASAGSAILLPRLGLTASWLRSALTLLMGYGWIVFSVWLAYALLWLGLSVPGLKQLLAGATFTRRYRRYHGPQRQT